MKATTNRHGRKDRARQRAARRRRRRTGNLRWAALFATLACLTTSAVPAEAGTGGASATEPDGTATGGQGFVFSTRCARPARPGTAPASTATTPPAARRCAPDTIGVAHRTLPCGTTIKLAYHGHSLVTQVIDRGPYTHGNDFDLTNGARRALGFEGADQVRYAVAIGHRGGAR